MGFFDLINQIWLKFLNLFPPEYHVLVTSIILIALIISFISLFMLNPILFIIVLIITLPILLPIISTFLTEVAKFLGVVPKTPITPPKP